ncbi:MAG: RHS repeat-associated core domain-containing protein [Edaphobacter sp.]
MSGAQFIYDCTPQHVQLCSLIASCCTGKERDAESGLDYFGARYLSSSMGRWMSPDSLNLTDDRLLNPSNTLNKYVYGANNPLKYTDPDGKDITIFYERPQFTGSFPFVSAGHIMYEAANQATGDAAAMSFGPVHDGSTVTQGLTLIGSPVNSTNTFSLTMTPDELRQNYASLTIQTRPEDTQKVIDFIRNLSTAANPYELYKTNCTTVCVEALKIIGILPSTNQDWSPQGLWSTLFANHAGSYWQNTSGWTGSQPGTNYGQQPSTNYDPFQLLNLLSKHCTDSWDNSSSTLTSTCN